MYLKSVKLRDWRSYRNAQFEFPAPTANKNVVLITAPNGYGKTSFFEAITLCLFGRDGLPLVPRARVAADGEHTDKLVSTYGRFLSGVLHRRALVEGRFSCSVVLVFADVDGELIEIQRKWHFRQDGSHKASDDELLIFEGDGRKPVAPPMTVTNREEWYRTYISQLFIPSSLAEFFLFDGEQVQRYAARGMASQVRMGIEGLLGLPLLRSTKESLARYATARRSAVAAPADEVVAALKVAISRLESELASRQKEISDADALLPALTAEIDELVAKLGGGIEGTVANLQELLKAEAAFQQEAERITSELIRILATDISMAISGSDLRNRLLLTLEKEEQREQWENGRRQGSANLNRFIADLRRRLAAVESFNHQTAVDDAVACASAAWDALWYPAPEGCADEVRHVVLSGAARARAMSRIASINQRSESELLELVRLRDAAIAGFEKKKSERQEAEQRAPDSDLYGKRLAEASSQRGRIAEQREAARKAAEAIEGELSAKRQEMGRYTDRLNRGGPELKRALFAEKAVAVIDAVLRDAVPTQVGTLAGEMTKAWKSMAHLADRVDKVEISPDCEVRMLTRKGEDIHQIEKSAGESQVFTQALIYAVTKVSGRSFPFVVDTPLARLSRDQRIGVLKTFCSKEGQVILLSTDEEVVDDKEHLSKIGFRRLSSSKLKRKTDW